MSKNRMVNTRFWSDSFVVDKLNALDRYLFLYLLTNERTNIIGIYELPVRTAAFETGIDKDDLQKMLHRLTPKVEYFDGWVYIRRFTEHQSTSPKLEIGMEREVAMLPELIRGRVKEAGISSFRLAGIFDRVGEQEAIISATDDMVSDHIDTVSDGMHNPPFIKSNSIKSNLIKTNTKRKAAKAATAVTIKVSSQEIDDLLAYWDETVDLPASKSKANREYAAKLIREHTIDDIKRMVQGVSLATHDKYAPRIANFQQLHRKWDDLRLWGVRTKNEISGGQGRGVKL